MDTELNQIDSLFNLVLKTIAKNFSLYGNLREDLPDNLFQRIVHNIEDVYLTNYITWILEQHSKMELRGITKNSGETLTVPLDMIYVTLKGDFSSGYERKQSRLLFERELRELEYNMDDIEFNDNQHGGEGKNARALRWRFLSLSPFMPSLVERDRPWEADKKDRFATIRPEKLTVGKAFQKEQVLVILGDPGSGKTTLARFITQKVAMNFKNKILQRSAVKKIDEEKGEKPDQPKEKKVAKTEEKIVNNNNNGPQSELEANDDSINSENQLEAADGENNAANNNNANANAHAADEEEGEDEEDDEEEPSSQADAMQIDEDSEAASAELDSLPVNKKRLKKNPQEAIEDDLKALESGNPKLPVLVRVSEYSEARVKDPELKLVDFLGCHSWLGQFPPVPTDTLNEMIKSYLKRNQAVVILDGLDEITTGSEREEIVREVETFVRDWVRLPNNTNANEQYWNPWNAFGKKIQSEATESTLGNQLIVTSRIAGYHACPLSDDVIHVTIEPLDGPSIERFCDSWTLAVHRVTSSKLNNEELRFKALALKKSILTQPSVRELATNPLLLTTLALLHYSGGSLPKQRVELYRIAVQCLVEVWRNSGLMVEEVIGVLSPLAFHIHSHYPTGLIEQEKLKAIVAKSLAKARNIDPNNPPSTFESDVNTFLTALREQVGLLAARGEFLYGFLHLTFQEYLAAIYLVRDPATAASEILRRVNQPRWREVIILALGEVGHSWPKAARDKLIVDLLLTEHSGQLAPHIGVSLKSLNEHEDDVLMREDNGNSNVNAALSPSKSRSPKRLFSLIWKKKKPAKPFRSDEIYGYINPKKNSVSSLTPWSSLFPRITLLISKIIPEYASNPGVSIEGPIVAETVVRLLEIYCQNTHFDYIRMTRVVTNTHKKGDKSTYSPITEKFKTEVQHAFEKIRQEIPEQVDQVLQTVLSVLKEKEHDVPWKTNPILIKTGSNNNAQASGDLKTDKQSRFNRAYAAASIISECEFISATLGLALLDVLDHDSPHWGWPINSSLRLMVRRDANGVFENNEVLKNKLKMRRLLKDGDNHEELLTSKLYRMVIALYGGLEDSGKFKPSLIYRDSLLTDEILPVLVKLKGKQLQVGNVKPLRSVLCNIWENSNLSLTYQHAEMKAQALLILSILGEDENYVKKSIDSANNGEFEKFCVKLFLNHVARLTNELTIVIRNIEEAPLFQTLEEEELPESTKGNMMQMAWTSLRNIADHKARTLIQWRVAAFYGVSDIPKLLKEAHDSLLKVSQCVHENHDTIYEFAVALDLGTEPGMNLVKTVHGTATQSLVFAKSLVPYMPADDIVSVKSEALFHSIKHSERRWSELYLANLNLGTAFAPDLGLLLGSGYDTPDLRKFYIDQDYNEHPEQAVRLALKTISESAEDAQAKARRFIRFSAWQPKQLKHEMLEKALAMTLNDSSQRPMKSKCDTLRLIALYHNDVNVRRKIFMDAARHAEEIPDKEIKADTLIALAPYLDNEKRQDVLQTVLNLIKKMSKEYQVGSLLSACSVLVSPYEKLKERHLQLVEKLKEGAKAVAKDRPPIHDVLAVEHIINVNIQLVSRWAPVIIINQMNSLMMEYSVPPFSHYETLWGALLDPLKQNQAVEAIRQYGVSQFYYVTNYIAHVVDSLLLMNQKALIADLLQYLWSPQTDLIPIVHNWFLKAFAAIGPALDDVSTESNTNADSTKSVVLSVDEKILRYSALLLGEGGMIVPETVPVLIRCLRMGDDRSRHRAVLVFNGTERFESLRNVSQFGVETALEIAAQALKYSRTEPGVSQILRWFWERTIHDDPEAIKKFVQLVNMNGAQAKEAHYLLSRIHLLAWSALDVLLDLLLNSSDSVQIPLLRAADNLLHLSAEHLPEGMRTKIQQCLLELHGKTSSDKVKVFLFRALEHDQKPIAEYSGVLKYSIENDSEKVAAFGIVALAQQSKGATRDESYFMTLLEIEQRPLVVRAVREALAGLWLRHDIKTPPNAVATAGSTLSKLAAIAKDPLEALDALTDVVKHYPWYYPALISRYYRVAGDLYETAPWLIEVVLKRLVDILSKPLKMDQSLLDLEDVEARYAAIEACAAVCQRLPAAFANHAQEYPHLDQLLIDAVCDEIFFTSRASAMLILGYLRRVTANVRRAFESAISDVIYVNQRAFEAAGRFRYVSEGVLPALQSGLRHRSPAIAYGYARLLATVAQGSAQDSSDSGDNHDRRSVMTKLAEALAEETERGRELYLLQETRDYRYEIIHVGKLHQAFLRMYLKIADVM